MKKVNIHEAKTQLSALIANLGKGQGGVLICRDGAPVAELTLITYTRRDPFKRHARLSKVKILGDITKPLSMEDWPEDSR